MANFQDNRIRCGKETALQLITDELDEYRNTIDFRKALGMKPSDEIRWDYSSQWPPVYNQLKDGRYDFGFRTRWFSDLHIIRAFITRYHDAEWWIQQDYVDIYHYYWSDGEVIEDIHRITDEDDARINALIEMYSDREDQIDFFIVLFTEKENQNRFVNFHPDLQSSAYLAYQDLVRKIAQEINAQGTFFLTKEDDYMWEGAYRHYQLAQSLRIRYLNKREEDLSAYKMGIMSLDILDEIQRQKNTISANE